MEMIQFKAEMKTAKLEPGEVERRKLDATRVQLSHDVSRTPDAIIQRYRENQNWRLYQKEWIYKNLLTNGAEVLDFGCGTGEITTQLAILGAKKVYAVDVTPGLLAATSARAELDNVSDRVETVCGFIENIPPRPVDLVVAFAVLHHCHPISKIMPTLLNWLRPGGTFVCAEPVVYFPVVETLRVASRVKFEPLDEGERKLDATDVDYLLGCLDDAQCIPFRLTSRADRWLPDRPLRRLDNLLFKLPVMSKLAGGMVLHGRKKAG